MKTFHDNHDRTWTVTINVDAIKRVRALVEVDLLQVVEGTLLERLVGDPILLCDVIYCLCKPEADAKEITDEEFGRAMAGDALDRAATALLEELVDFFPQAKREVLRKALAKLKTLETRVLAAVTEHLESPELEKRLEADLARLGGSFTNSPASSESRPTT